LKNFRALRILRWKCVHRVKVDWSDWWAVVPD